MLIRTCVVGGCVGGPAVYWVLMQGWSGVPVAVLVVLGTILAFFVGYEVGLGEGRP